jgi:hypothetical protein
MWQDFSHRSPQRELMDEENISFDEFHECLRELEKINTLTLAYRPTLGWIRKIMARVSEPLCILDVGSGGGDMLRRALFILGFTIGTPWLYMLAAMALGFTAPKLIGKWKKKQVPGAT